MRRRSASGQRAPAIAAHNGSLGDSARDHLIETYRRKAKHYDLTSRLYPVPGYPQRSHRLRAVRALGLRAGDTVVEIACGTGLNFSLIEQEIFSTSTPAEAKQPEMSKPKP